MRGGPPDAGRARATEALCAALVAVAALAAPARAEREPAHREAFRGETRVKLVVEQRSDDAPKLALPYYEVARVLLAYAGYETDADAELTITVTARAAAIERSYDDFTAGRTLTRYAGAEVSGTIAFDGNGASGRVSFRSAKQPAITVSGGRYLRPAAAPFERAFRDPYGGDGFAVALLRELVAIHGPDVAHRALRDRRPLVRRAALLVLAGSKQPVAVEAAVAGLADRHRGVQYAAAVFFRGAPEPHAVEPLGHIAARARSSDEDAAPLWDAVRATLVSFGAAGVPALAFALYKNRDPVECPHLIAALAEIPGPEAAQALLDLLPTRCRPVVRGDDMRWNVLLAIDPAAVAPGMRVSGASFAVLARATAHHDYEARTALHAIRILTRLADARSIKLLDKLQRSKHPAVASAARAALAELRRAR